MRPSKLFYVAMFSCLASTMAMGAANEVDLGIRDYAPDAATGETAEAPAVALAATQPQDVWWGNRSIAYGNYIRFEPVVMAARPVAPAAGPPVFNKIFFDLNKTVLRPEGQSEADRVVRAMQGDAALHVVVEGHTAPPESDSLGQRRADAVKSYLVSQGIAPSRIATQNQGDSQPWVADQQRHLNRRVVVLATGP